MDETALLFYFEKGKKKKQKKKRRQKRSAVRAARETARAMGDRTKGSGSKLAFLYETSTDLDSADT